MERYAKELHFISKLKPDGTKLELLPEAADEVLRSNDIYKLTCLSITHKTWVASGMNTYVVKLKCDVEPTKD